MNTDTRVWPHPPRLKVPWAALLLGLLLLLLWDASALDLAVMHRFGDAQGFALRDHVWLSHWLHRRGQQLAVLAYVLLLVMVWFPLGPWRALQQRERACALAATTLSLLAVSVMKNLSLSSCPWDLTQFGGQAQYISHWAWGVADGGAGGCFPSGHASSAFGFLAICLPFFASPHAPLRAHGRRLLLLIVTTGTVFGLTQTLRGAHYPSHSLWTAWICWSTAHIGYAGLLAALRRHQP